MLSSPIVMPRGRVPRDLLPSCALALSFAALTPLAAHAQSFQDLVPEITARIAAAVAPLDRVQLVTHDDGTADPVERRSLERELARALTARGLILVDRPDGAAVVGCTCSDTMRQRVCAADVRKDGTRTLVVAERWRDTRAASDVPPALVLALQPVFAQQTPILDLLALGSRVIVLDPSAVSIYERSGAGWRPTRSRPVASGRPWPRDVRGRLRIDGAMLEAFLPGTACRGPLDSLALTCTDEPRSWPIGIDNAGIAAGRNAFFTRAIGSFFSAAPLGPDAGARWLLATEHKGLVWLDESNQSSDAIPGHDDRWGDDVAAMKTACAAGTLVLIPARGSDAPTGATADTLRLFRAAGRRLTPATPPVILAGRVTAIWPDADPTRVLIVSRHAVTGIYEAFHAAVACAR